LEKIVCYLSSIYEYMKSICVYCGSNIGDRNDSRMLMNIKSFTLQTLLLTVTERL